jgi:CRISPR-associated endonuclease/helicase Cas3
MEWMVDVTLKPQFVATTEATYQGRRLHRIQRRFYEWDELPALTLMTAPTGTGKSYAFPLPIVRKKEQGGLSGRRGVVVAPTNALIDEMCQVYQRDFGSQLRVSALNRKILDELDAHGPERWNSVLQIFSDNDLIITNPDLLNFAIFGGYHRFKGMKGQLQFPELLAKVDYFVFDEYHLYDEEQIANVLAYIMLQQELISGRETKFIFASATPEKKLGALFQEQGWEYEEIIEPVLETEPDNGRMIHGEVAVHFRKASLLDLVREHADEAWAVVERGERVLLIFDRLRDLQIAKSELRTLFPNLRIAEESGYMTRASSKDDLQQAHIILGTNKLE